MNILTRVMFLTAALALMASSQHAVAQPVKFDTSSTTAVGDRPGLDIIPPSPVAIPQAAVPTGPDAIDITVQTAASRCENVCWGTKSCVAWTYVPTGKQGGKGQCWLKGGVPTLTPAGFISGILAEVKTDRPGGDYASISSTFVSKPKPSSIPMTLGTCHSLCFGDNKCLAWTFVTSTHTCWLKNQVPAAKPNANTISGTFEVEIIK